MAPEKANKKASQKTMLSYFPKDVARKREWRPEGGDFSSMRNTARKEGLFTDVTFVMGEGEQRKEFHAHKAILAFASPVFECMFYGPMAEKRPVIETDDDPEAFDMLLNYIYEMESETKFKCLKTAWKFFMIGDKYLVYKIEKKAKDSIKDIYWSDDKFWDVVQENNIIFSCPLIRDQLNVYIMESTEEFLATSKWLKVPETVVKDILQMDFLNIDEYTLLMEVTRWVYHNKTTFEQKVTSKILIEYYRHIRFGKLSSSELMKFMEKYPKALEAETYLEILRHAHGSSDCNLPEWCSTSKVCRKREYRDSRYGGLYYF